MSILIDDTVLDGKAARNNIVLNFKYRQALAKDVYNYVKVKDNAPDGDQALKVTVDLIVKHIHSWDLTDGKDAPIAASAENVAKLHHFYLERIANYIIGYAID